MTTEEIARLLASIHHLTVALREVESLLQQQETVNETHLSDLQRQRNTEKIEKLKRESDKLRSQVKKSKESERRKKELERRRSKNRKPIRF